MTSKSVVLPAPLGPMMPTISPWPACSDTSSRAAIPPNVTETLADLEVGRRAARGAVRCVRRHWRRCDVRRPCRGRSTTAARDASRSSSAAAREADDAGVHRHRHGRPPRRRRSSTARRAGSAVPAWRMASMAPSSCSTTMGERPERELVDEEQLGGVMVAMARASICCWPPERFPARSSRRRPGTGSGERVGDHVLVPLARRRPCQAAARRFSSTAGSGRSPRRRGPAPRRGGRSRPAAGG